MKNWLLILLCFTLRLEATTIVSAQTSTILANAKTTITNVNKLAFNGNVLFSPHSMTNENALGTNLFWQATNGIAMFCKTNFDGAKAYGFFGTNVANCTIEGTFTLVDGYTNNVIDNEAQFPTNGWIHVGLGVRFLDRFNFAGLCMVAANSSFQIDDRVAGTEFVTLRYMAPGTVTNGGRYTIRIENTSGNTANFYLYDVNRNLLTNILGYTFTGGVPAIGFQSIHGYATMSYWHSAQMWDANGLLTMDGSYPWVEVLTNRVITNTFMAGGVFEHFVSSNRTYNIQAWSATLSQEQRQNFTLTGTLTRVGAQSRLGGITFRSSPDAKQGYMAGYDHTNLVFRIWKNSPENPTVLFSSSAVTLTADTEYPFTLSANGSSLSFTCNSVTVSGSDSSYPSSGFIGAVGLNGIFSFKNLSVTTP